MPPGEYQERNPRRRSSSSLITGGVILLVLAVGGFLAWKAIENAPKEETPTPLPEAPAVVDIRLDYASSTMKFALKYPPEFTLQEAYAYTRVSPTKPISGVKFVAPATFTSGTNLAPDSGISIEELPRANNCSGDIFVKANVKAQSIPGTITYSVATSTETVGADTFEEAVFAIPGSSPCIAVRYFLHTMAATGTATTTQPFDRASLLAAFDSIRNSLSVK